MHNPFKKSTRAIHHNRAESNLENENAQNNQPYRETIKLYKILGPLGYASSFITNNNFRDANHQPPTPLFRPLTANEQTDRREYAEGIQSNYRENLQKTMEVNNLLLGKMRNSSHLSKKYDDGLKGLPYKLINNWNNECKAVGNVARVGEIPAYYQFEVLVTYYAFISRVKNDIERTSTDKELTEVLKQIYKNHYNEKKIELYASNDDSPWFTEIIQQALAQERLERSDRQASMESIEEIEEIEEIETDTIKNYLYSLYTFGPEIDVEIRTETEDEEIDTELGNQLNKLKKIYQYFKQLYDKFFQKYEKFTSLSNNIALEISILSNTVGGRFKGIPKKVLLKMIKHSIIRVTELINRVLDIAYYDIDFEQKDNKFDQLYRRFYHDAEKPLVDMYKKTQALIEFE